MTNESNRDKNLDDIYDRLFAPHSLLVANTQLSLARAFVTCILDSAKKAPTHLEQPLTSIVTNWVSDVTALFTDTEYPDTPSHVRRVTDDLHRALAEVFYTTKLNKQTFLQTTAQWLGSHHSASDGAMYKAIEHIVLTQL